MKILIVTKPFHPDIYPRAFRATELAKEFSRQGHRVKVLTIERDAGNYKELLSAHKNIRIESIDPLIFSPITIEGRRFALFRRVLRRLLLLLFEYPEIELTFKFSKALKNEGGYDLLISNAIPYPVHWAVARARTLRHPIAKTWVADCGDPYMGCDTDSFKKLFYFAFIEKWFCRKADYLSIPIESARAGYYEEFQDKIRIIPQGFTFDKIESRKRKEGDLTPQFAYAGGFIPKVRDPRPFLAYLSTIEQPFKFIIYTRSADLIRAHADKMGDKIEIRSYIPRSELLPRLAEMDFLVNFDNNTEVQSPSKLIDYALVKRPILNIGSDFQPSIVDQFIAGNYSQSLNIPNLEQYNIKNVARQFLDLLT